MSSGEPEIDPALSAEERRALLGVAERLEYERPVPSAAFRGELRRRLTASRRSTARRYRALAACYVGLGLLCLAVSAAGLAGTGPFAA